MPGSLVSIDAWNRRLGRRETVRVGTSRNSVTLGADGFLWEPCLRRQPQLTQPLADEDLSGTLQVGTGQFSINAKQLTGVTDWRDLDWVGATVRVYSGDSPLLAQMGTEIIGRISAGVTDAATGVAALRMEADRPIVDVPLLTRTYEGSGGLEGPIDMAGNFKPAGWGRPINVQPVLINSTLYIYQVDAYGNLLSIDGLFENLAAFGPTAGDFPTYQALADAQLDKGQWGTCLAQGLLRIGAQPSGTITCDPVFRYGTPGQMMLRWLRAHAGLADSRIVVSDFTTLDSTLEALLGATPAVSFWTTDEGSVVDMLQRMCASVNATPLLRLDGRVGVARVLGGATLLTLKRQGGTPPVTSWSRVDPPVPWYKLRMTAARSYYVNGPAEIDYEDDIISVGVYDPAVVYRQGNVVFFTDGTQYLYINSTPSQGHEPPDPNYWAVYSDTPDATQIKYPSGYTLADKEPAEKDATSGAPAGTYVNGVLAEDLIGSVIRIASDGWLSTNEKPGELLNWLNIVSRRDTLITQYNALGAPADLTPFANAAFAAVSALAAYLDSLTPRWDDASYDTLINPSEYRDKWTAAYQTLNQLNAKITGRPGKDAEVYSLVAAGANFGKPDNLGLRGADGQSFVDPDYTADPNHSGRDARSYTVCWRDSPKVWHVRHFDLYDGTINYAGNPTPPGSGIQGFSDCIDNIPLGAVVAIYTWDEPSANHLHPLVNSAFSKVGAQMDVVSKAWAARSAFVHVGVKGWLAGRGISLQADSGIVQTTFQVVNNIPSAAGTGPRGLPGEIGPDGKTYYPYYAYADSFDGTVNFTTLEPNGRTWEGFKLGLTPTEPGNPAEYSWRPYGGPPFGMASRGNIALAQRTITKTGGAAQWDSDAYSTSGYGDGCIATARAPDGTGTLMFGLNSDPRTDASYGSLDYAWYLRGDNSACIYESGQAVPNPAVETVIVSGYGAGRFDVKYTGRFIQYLYNDVVYRQVDAGFGRTFYFDSSLLSVGAKLLDIDFSASGSSLPQIFLAANLTSQRYTGDNAPVPQDMIFTATRYNSPSDPYFSVIGSDGSTQLGWGRAIDHANNYPQLFATSGPDDFRMKASGNWSAAVCNAMIDRGAVPSYTVQVATSLTNGVVAKVSVAKVKDGDKGQQGGKGDPLFGFVQDDYPGPPAFDQQTWYRPTSRELYYGRSGSWVRALGLLAAENVIASSAFIADLVVINAHIQNLTVGTEKVQDSAISAATTVSGANGNVSSSGFTTIARAGHIIRSTTSQMMLGFSGEATLPGLPTGNYMEVRILNETTGEVIGPYRVSNAVGSLQIFSYFTFRSGLAGPVFFSLQAKAYRPRANADYDNPGLRADLLIQEFKK